MRISDVLEALPLAVYTTDAGGALTFYNQAAADLWGRRPVLGVEKWCGSARLFTPGGRPIALEDCPMAVALKERRNVRGVEAVLERPDGARVPFLPYPTLLYGDDGEVTGAINVLVELTDRRHAELESARLAAIVTSSDDAIISKTLDGVITSWNAGASRIFGYAPEEMIGQPIFKLIPDELRSEEDEIIARLKRGERIEHFDTRRRTKDGRLIDISLTISPIRDRAGNVVGASKVARDISERRRGDDLQRLLFDELNHRVKNTLAIIQAIAGQSLRRAASPEEFVTSFNGRVQALGRAHDLLVSTKMKGADLTAIIREQVLLGGDDNARIACSGPMLMLSPQMAVQFGLVLHELASNARKHGALSISAGRLDISWRVVVEDGGRVLRLAWRESGAGPLSSPVSRGFGTTLIERTLQGHGGGANMRFTDDGVACDIKVVLPDDAGTSIEARAASMRSDYRAAPEAANQNGLSGKRILVVEDEPMIAMDIEGQLQDAGCVVVGPAETLHDAARLIADGGFDAALLDCNLSGDRVDELARQLSQRGIPFAFATGYGRDALPRGFHDAPLLEKPFAPGQLVATLNLVLRQRASAPGSGALRSSH